MYVDMIVRIPATHVEARPSILLKTAQTASSARKIPALTAIVRRFDLNIIFNFRQDYWINRIKIYGIYSPAGTSAIVSSTSTIPAEIINS